jgi:hypothetical protein
MAGFGNKGITLHNPSQKDYPLFLDNPHLGDMTGCCQGYSNFDTWWTCGDDSTLKFFSVHPLYHVIYKIYDLKMNVTFK